MLEEKYSVAVKEAILLKSFDVETMVNLLQNYTIDCNGNIRSSKEDRVAWETHGEDEFMMFWKTLSSLPQITKLIEESDLNLLPHDGPIVFRRLKTIMFNLFWKNKYSCFLDLFIDEKRNNIDLANSLHLVSIKQRKAVDHFHLNEMYDIELSDGSTHQVQLNETKIYSLFYSNESVYSSAGKEVCIVLDVALGSCGCEAVVEGFYSLVKAHTQTGGQSNEVLMERAVVDWILPHPISCPKIVGEITKIYTEGDKENGLKQHRSVKFFDPAGRAFNKYDTSKVVDRQREERGSFISLLS